MTIVETSVFTRRVLKSLEDDDYAELQFALAENPQLGNIMPGCGGIRKVRWRLEGRGKSGGVRIIYYWAKSKSEILMLLIYPKNEQDNLTPDQKKSLRRVVEEEYR